MAGKHWHKYGDFLVRRRCNCDKVVGLTTVDSGSGPVLVCDGCKKPLQKKKCK